MGDEGMWGLFQRIPHPIPHILIATNRTADYRTPWFYAATSHTSPPPLFPQF
jgi:hypothetical protein